MAKAYSLLVSERNQLLFILLFWAIVVLIINPYGEFPFNDDWLYARSVKVLVETGKFYMSPLTSVNLFFQIGWGALFCLPFGFSFTALRISTLVAGGLGLWGTYRLINVSTNNRQMALIGTLLTLVNPIYLGLSASFMTDVPFYTLVVWTMAYMISGFKQDSTRLMLIGLGLAIVALLIRQLGVALFIGFALAFLVRKGINLKNLLIAGAVVVVGMSVQIIYQKWMVYMMPDMVMYNAQARNFFHLSYYKLELIKGFINNTFVALMYVGLFLFPYFLLLLTKQSWSVLRANWWLWLLISAVVIIIWQTFFDGMSMPIWFNVLSPFGIGPALLRDLYYRLYVLPIPNLLYVILTIVTWMSLIGSICILYYLVKIVSFLLSSSISSLQRALAVLLVSFLGIYFFPIGMQVLFDRYLLPIPILLLILVYWIESNKKKEPLKQTLPITRYLSIGLGLGYLIFSVGATHDYLAWNRVRWQMLDDLMQQGVKPNEMDGGHEFNGWYLYNNSYVSSPTKSWWWVYDDTYVVGTSITPGYTLYRKQNVDTWFPWGIQQIIIGKKSDPSNVTRLKNPYGTN